MYGLCISFPLIHSHTLARAISLSLTHSILVQLSLLLSMYKRGPPLTCGDRLRERQSFCSRWYPYVWYMYINNTTSSICVWACVFVPLSPLCNVSLYFIAGQTQCKAFDCFFFSSLLCAILSCSCYSYFGSLSSFNLMVYTELIVRYSVYMCDLATDMCAWREQERLREKNRRRRFVFRVEKVACMRHATHLQAFDVMWCDVAEFQNIVIYTIMYTVRTVFDR